MKTAVVASALMVGFGLVTFASLAQAVEPTSLPNTVEQPRQISQTTFPRFRALKRGPKTPISLQLNNR